MKRYTPWMLLSAFVAALVIAVAFGGTPTRADDNAARVSDLSSFAMGFRPEHDDDDEHDEEDWEEWGDEYEEFEMMMGEIEMYSTLLELIEQYSDIAKDSNKAAIAAVLAVDEHLDTDEARQFLNEMLAANPKPEVKRAIHLKMLDLHDEQDTGAVKRHLRALITGQ